MQFITNQLIYHASYGIVIVIGKDEIDFRLGVGKSANKARLKGLPQRLKSKKN